MLQIASNRVNVAKRKRIRGGGWDFLDNQRIGSPAWSMVSDEDWDEISTVLSAIYEEEADTIGSEADWDDCGGGWSERLKQ